MPPFRLAAFLLLASAAPLLAEDNAATPDLGAFGGTGMEASPSPLLGDAPSLLAPPAPAEVLTPESGAQGYAIAAVVGDSVISTYDLSERMRLVIGTAGLSNTPETRSKLLPQILKQLIDEQLQLQEATRRGKSVSDDEMKTAIATIEANNNKPAGSLLEYLAAQGISIPSFQQQVRAQVAMSKLVNSIVRPQVRISDTELKRAIANKVQQSSRREVSITPLLLTVDKPEQEAETKALAEKILTEVKGGASFASVAQQLGEAQPTGSMDTWVNPEQLEPELIAAVNAAKPGDIVGPIRSPRGYNIIKVNDSRVTRKTEPDAKPAPVEVYAKQVLLKLEPNASTKEVQVSLDIVRAISKQPNDCKSQNLVGVQNLEQSGITVSYLRSRLDQLPDYARDRLAALGVGDVGEPFATPEGIRFYQLCERTELPASEAEPDDALRNELYGRKLELEVTKFMRDLRRKTFIEIRL